MSIIVTQAPPVSFSEVFVHVVSWVLVCGAGFMSVSGFATRRSEEEEAHFVQAISEIHRGRIIGGHSEEEK